MTSVWTCEAKPTIGIALKAGSAFMTLTVPNGSVRELFRSTMTSFGGELRMAANAVSDERANETGTPRCAAAPLIFDVNSRSSRIARITA